jgi:hypothetical protein
MCKAKSIFAAKEIKILGHIVNSENICPDPKRSRLSKIGLCRRTFMRFVHFWAWLISFVSLLVIT